MGLQSGLFEAFSMPGFGNDNSADPNTKFMDEIFYKKSLN